MSDELKDRVVLLTGGGNGIGRECANAYARAGAIVVVADLDADGANETVKGIGAGLAVPCDVTRAADVERTVQLVLEKYGRINAVHNNTGMGEPSKPLHETTEAQWDRMLDVNLKSVFLTTRYAFDALRTSNGCILNTASMVGLIGQENHAAYVASKGGMIALTKAMALDYATYGIRVNAICPSAAWTPMLRKWMNEQPNPHEMEDYLNNMHALGYCPEADVIADAAVFLLSDRARFVTGIALPVSGGAELGYRR